MKKLKRETSNYFATIHENITTLACLCCRLKIEKQRNGHMHMVSSSKKSNPFLYQ